MRDSGSTSPGDDLRAPFVVDGWAVAPDSNRMSRGDQTRQLEPRVMQVLTYLAKHRGEVVRRHELLINVWAVEFVGDEALSRSISIIRKAFDDDPRASRVIETIAKTGYRLLAEGEIAAPKSRGVPPSTPRWSASTSRGPATGWFTYRVAHLVPNHVLDEDWRALVRNAEVWLGVPAGAAAMSDPRTATWHSARITITLTVVDGTPPGSHLVVLLVRDRLLAAHLASAPLGVLLGTLVGVGLSGIGFPSPIAAGAAIAVLLGWGGWYVGQRAIRREVSLRQRELGKLLTAMS